MAGDLIGKLRRALRKDPRYIVRRLWLEATMAADRWLLPRRVRALDLRALARRANHADLDALWMALAARPYAHPMLRDKDALERLEPGAVAEVMVRAERAHRHEVDLLGSGARTLPAAIDWLADLKTGHRWPPAFHRDIDYNNFGRDSDVKGAWELSRLQWALPLGQAWLLSGEDRHAAKARALLQSWIDANPCGHSVNWACTMEPALRLLSWTWLFHACADAPSWRDGGFREQLLRALYLHGDFVVHNLERADINGNHYTADAAGLVYAGQFFGQVGHAPRWASLGWAILVGEMPRQVFADGVDFEASVPYHRLVLELFAYPALYRQQQGLPVQPAYRERLLAMGRFTAAYSRNDGSVPLWGDADDGRGLALGTQPLNDHRYLVGLLGQAFGDAELMSRSAGPRDEVAWLLGEPAAAQLPARTQAPPQPSQAFVEGGFYVLRSGGHHVFVDCGPLGLAGRGGHGHNDLLALEAVLDGVHLLSDCGAYLYTASPTERNNFRSTAYHNTPQLDGQEINRFVRPDYLWVLHNDAAHECLEWSVDAQRTRLVGRHTGYQRLAQPVTVRRQIELQHASGRLDVVDRFDGAGEHEVCVPWHLAPGVRAVAEPQCSADGLQGVLRLAAGGRAFELHWQSNAPWQAQLQPARVSPTYGRVLPTQVLRLSRRGALHGLQVTLQTATAQTAAMAR